MNGTLLESKYECTHCDLCYDSYSYGIVDERIGYVCWVWNLSGDYPRDNARFPVLEEARRLWNHPEYQQHWHPRRRDIWNNTGGTTISLFADWLEDREFPLTAQYLRTQQDIYKN